MGRFRQITTYNQLLPKGRVEGALLACLRSWRVNRLTVVNENRGNGAQERRPDHQQDAGRQPV